MNIIHVGLSFSEYKNNITSFELSKTSVTKIQDTLLSIKPKKISVFGSNKGTGLTIRRVLRNQFSGYINTETFDPEHDYDYDAIILATGPKHYSAIKSILKLNKRLRDAKIITLFNDKPADPSADIRPCHYSFLYIRSDGNAYPCCSTWSPGKNPVFNVNDANIIEKLAQYDYKNCSCENVLFRKATHLDTLNIQTIIIATSLRCNSKCAMCNHHCPEYTNEHRHKTIDELDKRNKLTDMIKLINPNNIIFHGGEVLIHPEELEWIKSIKDKFPDISLEILSNGNVDVKIAEQVFQIVDKFAVGFYGFQDQTYKTMTKMNLSRTVRFTERLLDINKENVFLKYLTTPLTLHEAPLFLRWALKRRPAGITFTDAGTQGYISYDPSFSIPAFSFEGNPNDLPRIFWKRIIQRSIKELRDIVKENTDYISKEGIKLYFGGGLFNSHPII